MKDPSPRQLIKYQIMFGIARVLHSVAKSTKVIIKFLSDGIDNTQKWNKDKSRDKFHMMKNQNSLFFQSELYLFK